MYTMNVGSAFASVSGMQLDFFPPKSDWVAPQVLPDWDASGQPLSIDCETEDRGIKEDWGAGWAVGKVRVIGVSVATPGQTGVYLPFGHPEGNGPYGAPDVAKWLNYQIKRAKTIVGHNIGYDIGSLSTIGVKRPDNIFCTQVAAALLDENRRSYSLDGVSREYGLRGKDTALMDEAFSHFRLGKSKREKMSNLWKLPSKYVGPYAEDDANLPLELYTLMRRELHDQDMDRLVAIEMDMVLLAYEMRKKGIRVDIDYAEQLNKKWIQDQLDIEKKIHEITGLHIKPNNSDDLKRLCEYEDIYDIPRTEKKDIPSFKNKWLSTLQKDSIEWVVRWRNIQHGRNNYVEGIVLNRSVNGRVHCEINTVKKDEGGTVSGRMSVANPPLQQISARNPLVGPAVRACFLPEKNEFWASFDYSQQEPRLSVHFASLLNIVGAQAAVDYYTSNPDADFHQMMADLSGQPRKVAKDIFLGMVYGMGNAKLAIELDCELDECIRVRNGFDAEVPWVSALSEACIDRASSAGYIRTLLSRRCRFDFWEPYGKEAGRHPLREADAKRKWPNKGLRRAFIYKALNRLIQGSAADQTKEAMAVMFREGIIPMLQMHDELDVSVPHPKHEIIEHCRNIMLESTKLIVPSKVDLGIGINWGEAA